MGAKFGKFLFENKDAEHQMSLIHRQYDHKRETIQEFIYLKNNGNSV